MSIDTKKQKSLEDYQKEFRKKLKDFHDCSGHVFYSSFETLKQGKVYFLGLNPGDDGSKQDREATIGKALENMCQFTGNYYLGTKSKDDSVIPEEKQSKFQKNIHRLIDGLEKYELKDICASNLIFMRSVGMSDFPKTLKKYIKQQTPNRDIADGDIYQECVELCWPIHEKVITEIVKPKFILTFGIGGQSARQHILNLHRQHYNTHPKEYFFPKDAKPSASVFKTKIGEQEVTVIAIPHFSRFFPSDKTIEITNELINKDFKPLDSDY